MCWGIVSVPSPQVRCVWAGCSSCATHLDLLVSWTPPASHALSHLWQKWIGVQRKTAEAQKKCQENFPPGSALCTAEESCTELKKKMILIIWLSSAPTKHSNSWSSLILTKNPFIHHYLIYKRWLTFWILHLDKLHIEAYSICRSTAAIIPIRDAQRCSVGKQEKEQAQSWLPGTIVENK